MSDVMKPFVCECEIELDKSADEVWSWISDLENIMTTNQFHVAVDTGGADAAVGTETQIFHELVPFPRHERIAKINLFEDGSAFALGWSERHVLPFPDPFPHGESWRVADAGKGRCRLANQVRGAWTTPVGRAIGPYIWKAMFTTILQKDLQEVAVAVGAIDEKQEIAPVPEHDRLHWLTLAMSINGQDAGDYMDAAPPVFGDYAAYMAEHPFPFA